MGLFQVWLGQLPAIQAQTATMDANDPQASFERLWKTFDEKYSLFGVKGVDWKTLYRVYRPRVTKETTDQELLQILCDLIRHLNDNHVQLISTNPERHFSAGYLHYYFSPAGGSPYGQSLGGAMGGLPVPKTYVIRDLKEEANGIFDYGWAEDGVGYFHFDRFGHMDASREAIDKIVGTFKEAKAIIIDIRRNGGGDDRVGKMIADRFADKKRLYMTTRDRNGPNHDDFAEPKEWYVEPDGPFQFTKPVLLLTDRTSVKAAENFALAMKVLPHVVQVGDLTSGCFADPDRYELPNGWSFTVSRNLFLDCQGFCWEGIGVPPEIWQPTSREDVEKGKDPVFELALAIIDAGGLQPKRFAREPFGQ